MFRRSSRELDTDAKLNEGQFCLVKGNQAYVPDTTVHNDDVWVRWLTKISNDCSIFFHLPFHQADLPLSVHFQQMISRNTPEN